MPDRTGRRGRRSRHLIARAPLRVRLVAGVLVLVVVALAGSGLIGVATTRAYLIGRVDSQLRAVAEHPGDTVPIQGAAGKSVPGGDGGGGGGGPDAGGANGHRLPSAYVVEVTDASGVIAYGPTSDLVDATEPLPRLPAMTAAQSTAAGSRTTTVPAVSGAGQWRVLVQPVTLSDGATGTLLVAQSLGDVAGTVDHLALLLAVVGGAAVLVVAVGAYGIVRLTLRPLRKVEHTAAAIAGGDLTRRVPAADPRTEVGQLSAALNTMLTEIETAFSQRERSEAAARESENRMRRFVADASHELRTPLTSIRGFAELYRQGAASSETDVARMMGRVEAEATRMGLLVEDLLMLARLDQQRPLARQPVDLLALAADAVHDAQAVDPTRSVRLEIGATDPPPIVTGDEARLRQILANLVGNALQHTPAGTAVTVTVATGRSRRADTLVATMAVTDDGTGMTQDDATRVFERFYRADTARTHADGGTGLGLSIVAALAAAHGGTVDLDTAPGEGSRFVVELPLAEVSTPRD